ncbi:uncharacterized protein LOC117242635 [Bombus vosnesenskii]|uniref:Uncharacterized protein LOC117242635 n=2 Tax=Pyrobombus TaxID=144703 RepID=A0A6J3LJD0_9HYME|nr:uncharacterized protein LOC117161241 [Bombus vancouverensis nearcticus]XP_033316541.1 uncharacterized protein LOC117214496 [Bombus bifarius]XP_033365375.1 uncharacterized protein LOC117242635 [Bombus vosnesenskii]
MQETSTVKGMISNRNRDCLGCRIFSGCGLIGSGLYVAYHSKKFQKWTGKTTMYTMGSALMLLGTARVLDLPPFRKQSNHG